MESQEKLETLFHNLEFQLMGNTPENTLGSFYFDFLFAVNGSSSEREDALLCYQKLSELSQSLDSTKLKILKKYAVLPA